MEESGAGRAYYDLLIWRCMPCQSCDNGVRARGPARKHSLVYRKAAMMLAWAPATKRLAGAHTGHHMRQRPMDTYLQLLGQYIYTAFSLLGLCSGKDAHQARLIVH